METTFTQGDRDTIEQIARAVLGEPEAGHPGLVSRVVKLEKWRYAGVIALFLGAFGGTYVGGLF